MLGRELGVFSLINETRLGRIASFFSCYIGQRKTSRYILSDVVQASVSISKSGRQMGGVVRKLTRRSDGASTRFRVMTRTTGKSSRG